MSRKGVESEVDPCTGHTAASPGRPKILLNKTGRRGRDAGSDGKLAYWNHNHCMQLLRCTVKYMYWA